MQLLKEISFTGLHLAASFPNHSEKDSDFGKSHYDTLLPLSNKTPPLESTGTGTSVLASAIASKNLEPLLSSLVSTYSLNSSTWFSSLETMSTTPSLSDSRTLSYMLLNSSSNYVPYDTDSYYSTTLPSSRSKATNDELSHQISNYISDSVSFNVVSSKLSKVESSDLYSHFHTPLMSLLLVTPTSSWPNVESTLTTSQHSSNHVQSLTTSSSDNEISNPHHLSVPNDQDHKKLLMLVLRAEDCTKFSKSDFEKMLSKLMAKFGFNDVIPEVSNAKCYSHLNINVTVGGPTPTLRFLPNIDGKNNFTVDVLNRTFRIVKLEKVNLRLEKTKSSNVTSNIITAVAKHESVAYIAVGVSFGLIIVICVSVCCIKCCLKKPQKRYGVPKGTHIRLRPEDYTLTPIPRPSSLYVDYYRGSGTGDIFSTTSAGSIASTTPTVEQGVVQPFDTSIVPLEDSSNLPLDSSRDPSVESVPVQSDLKTFNINSLSGKGFRTVSTDSKEQLNPKAHSKRVEIKPSGVANPSFQRY